MEISEVQAWEDIMKHCHEDGLPNDMMDAFLPHYYIPQPKQIEFHVKTLDCDHGVRYIGNGGGRGSGKTTAIFAQVALYDCQKWGPLSCLYVRKVMKSAADSFGQLTAALLQDYPGCEYNSERISFANGSTITIAGLKNADDVDKYVGLNYELMVIEEANQLDKERIEKLLGSLRTGKLTGYHPRVYMSFNPGGPGMAYLKDRFIKPWREGRETNSRFIPSGFQDNKFLDRGYIEDYLNNLTGNLRKMWRDGDFDVQGGMAFDTFNRDIYVYDRWPIGDDWIRIRGIDDGYYKPYCCLWLAKDPATGRIVVYDEDYGENHTNGEQAERIKSMTPSNHRIMISYADPSMWIRNHHTDTTVKTPADIYADHGVYISKGDNDRHSGLAKIRELMRYKPDGLPGLIILSKCKNLIWQFENMPVSPRDSEDIDTDFEDHALDALKYGLSGTTGAEKQRNTERRNRERHPLYSLGW